MGTENDTTKYGRVGTLGLLAIRKPTNLEKLSESTTADSYTNLNCTGPLLHGFFSINIFGDLQQFEEIL